MNSSRSPLPSPVMEDDDNMEDKPIQQVQSAMVSSPQDNKQKFQALHAAVVAFNVACDEKRRGFTADLCSFENTPLKRNKQRKNKILKDLKIFMQVFENDCQTVANLPYVNQASWMLVLGSSRRDESFHQNIGALYAAHLALLQVSHVGLASQLAPSISVSNTAKLVEDFIKLFHFILPEAVNEDYQAVIAIFERAQTALRDMDKHKDNLQDQLNANKNIQVARNKAAKISLVTQVTEVIGGMISLIVPDAKNDDQEVTDYEDVLDQIDALMPSLKTAMDNSRKIPHAGWMSLFSSVLTTPDSKTSEFIASFYNDMAKLLGETTREARLSRAL